MRGTFGVDFDLETVYKVARALPEVVERANGAPGRRWLVGRDCRTTGEAMRAALVRGLVDAGAEVTDLGLCTTPMVYFFTAEDGYDGSVMITASHNPPGDNGLKVSKRGAFPVGYADGLDEVERIVGSGKDAGRETKDVTGRTKDAGRETLARYAAWQDQHSTLNPQLSTLNSQPSTLRFAVDCSNGMASLLVKELFPGAVIINDTLDGSFPNHSPNPLKAEAREQLAALVRERGLDCGVIFDGDADRCMFVDERGEFVQPDYLIPVVARATLADPDCDRQQSTALDSSRSTAVDGDRQQSTDSSRQPSTALDGNRTIEQSNNRTISKIIHDVRTSRGAIEAIRRLGCEPVMVPVGHAFAKPILRESGAVCGGELAGHYYFREFFCCDSGVLAARRILGEVARAKAEGKTFSEMMKPISGAYANSGELNFKVEDKDAAIRRVLACAAANLPREVSRSEMDGIRIEYETGWINVRKSNTEPYLRLLVEAKTADVLNDWVSALKGAIEG